MPFAELSTRTKTALAKLAERTSKVASPKVQTFHFSTAQLRLDEEPAELIAKVANWARRATSFIYVFEAQADAATLATLHQRVTAAKSAKDGRAYPRLFSPSPVLYVGGSQSLRSRFREHLGYASKAVYAMQLAHWASELDVPLTFKAAKYADDTAPSLLGALEDQLWTELKPMMGRQGRN